MCAGVGYLHEGQAYRVYFPNPSAVLPVRTKSAGIQLLPWGRRKEQAGRLPLGGWARLDAIYGGRWDRFSPKPVLLAVDRFTEKDHEGQAHWYDLTRGQYIQGLVARLGSERRVYVVTIDPEHEDAVHYRWPRIVSALR